MSYPKNTIKMALEWTLVEIRGNPEQSIHASMWGACGRIEQIDENRRTLYEEISARIRIAAMDEQVMRALKELGE